MGKHVSGFSTHIMGDNMGLCSARVLDQRS